MAVNTNTVKPLVKPRLVHVNLAYKRNLDDFIIHSISTYSVQ